MNVYLINHTLVLILALVASPTAAREQIYRWIDDNGRVHFSNQKPALVRL
jgi:hypothetical protein